MIQYKYRKQTGNEAQKMLRKYDKLLKKYKISPEMRVK